MGQTKSPSSKPHSSLNDQNSKFEGSLI